MQQTQVIPMPSDFKVPFKEGYKFELNGMVMEIYEIKKPKPNPRFLVKAIGLIVAMEEPGEVVGSEMPAEGGGDGQSETDKS